MEPAVGALLSERKRKEYDRKWHKIHHAPPLSGRNGTLLFRSSSRLSLADLIKTQEDECDRKLGNEYEGCVLHHRKRTRPRGWQFGWQLFATPVGLASALVARTRSRLRQLYRLDDAARRMRRIVLSVFFAAAFAIIIAMIVRDFVGAFAERSERPNYQRFTNV
jgi:hypothetical protein